MSLEKMKYKSEIESTPEYEKVETELKFTPTDPHFFDFLLGQCEIKNIHQTYLSHPNEQFSLRLRAIETNGQMSYSAALKSRGTVGETGVSRLETPTQLSAEAYEKYLSRGQFPSLTKRRVEPVPGVTVDWIDGWDLPIIELEDFETNEGAQLFYQMYVNELNNRSGEKEVDNEHIAHVLSGVPIEYEPFVDLDPEKIVNEIMAYRSAGYKKIIVGLSGRSGSGKSTVARKVQTLLAYLTQQPSSLLSTDDYHVGKSFLESHYEKPWKNWDASVVYDTVQLSRDLQLLKQGKEVDRRYFSFETQEPYVDGKVVPHDIIIVEGIHAGSNDLKGVRTLYFDLETPLATCIGRDISRLRDGSRPNSSIGSPEERLRYQLEIAEPSFWQKDIPGRNRWSASVRPIGSIALK